MTVRLTKNGEGLRTRLHICMIKSDAEAGLNKTDASKTTLVRLHVSQKNSYLHVHVHVAGFLLWGGGGAFIPPWKTFCPPLENSKFQF